MLVYIESKVRWLITQHRTFSIRILLIFRYSQDHEVGAGRLVSHEVTHRCTSGLAVETLSGFEEIRRSRISWDVLKRLRLLLLTDTESLLEHPQSLKAL